LAGCEDSHPRRRLVIRDKLTVDLPRHSSRFRMLLSHRSGIPEWDVPAQDE
jgi:hypothetical protein